MILSQKQCPFCNAPLDIHQAALGRTCGATECEKKKAARLSREHIDRLAERRQLFFRKCDQHLRTLMAEGHLHQPEDWELAVVPRNNVSVKPQNPDRRQEFLSNLQAVAEAVFAEIESESIPELPEISEDQGSDFIIQACTTCKGKCCSKGETHAFLNPVVIHRWFARNPGATVADCLNVYEARLPEDSYEDSCVFQGSLGCVLPRDLRSSICNFWLCDDLELACDSFRKSSPATTVYASGMFGGVINIRIIDHHSGECVDETQLDQETIREFSPARQPDEG